MDVIDPYATDVDEENIGVVRIKDSGRIVDTYWQHDDTWLPENHQLVIYEMHVADFSGGEIAPHKRGKYVDAIAKLDYLCKLGINAIESMPVNEYPGDYNWGYRVRHFFATESSYGTTLLITAMNVPMLWMGEEFGEHKRKSETVTQPQKIAWPLLSKLNQNLFESYNHLIALRKQSIALQSDNIEFFHENSDRKVLAYVRWHDQDQRVVVIAFSDQHLAGYRVPNFPAVGMWRELTGDDVEVPESGLVIDLPEL